MFSLLITLRSIPNPTVTLYQMSNTSSKSVRLFYDILFRLSSSLPGIHPKHSNHTFKKYNKLHQPDCCHSRYHLPKKKNQCPLPESDTTDSLIPQSTPEQTREKTPSIRSRTNVRLSSCRGQLLTDPSPGTMTRICSPFPTLVTSCPTPFKFAQESCFLFFPTCNAGKQQITHCTHTVRN